MGDGNSRAVHCCVSELPTGRVASIFDGRFNTVRRRGVVDHGITSTQARRLHAAGQHPHRRLALSRRLAGHEFQLRAHQALRPDAGARRSSTPSSWPTTWPCSTCRWTRSSAATRSTSFEPFTLLSALSQATEHIGLVATGSTTFDAPYHIARRFASLDHHQRRPRRLEHRHHLQSGRGAELRHGRAHGARRALSRARASSTTS